MLAIRLHDHPGPSPATLHAHTIFLHQASASSRVAFPQRHWWPSSGLAELLRTAVITSHKAGDLFFFKLFAGNFGQPIDPENAVFRIGMLHQGGEHCREDQLLCKGVPQKHKNMQNMVTYGNPLAASSVDLLTCSLSVRPNSPGFAPGFARVVQASRNDGMPYGVQPMPWHNRHSVSISSCSPVPHPRSSCGTGSVETAATIASQPGCGPPQARCTFSTL